MRTFFIIIFLIIISTSCNVLIKSTKLKLEGQVISSSTIHTQHDTLFIKSDIFVYTKDSILISNLVTDENGVFMKQIKVKKYLLPLLISVNGLETKHIDTLIQVNDKTKITRFDFGCLNAQYEYTIKKNDYHIVTLPCVLGENSVTTQP